MAISTLDFTLKDFNEAKWEHTTLEGQSPCYSSLMRSLQDLSKIKDEAGLKKQADVLALLAHVASMRLSPNKMNQPLQPLFIDYQNDNRAVAPEDFSKEEIEFLESVLSVVTDPWLKTRIADLLWISKKPKDPSFARKAIDSYVSHEIDISTWEFDVKHCYARALALCRQLKERERFNKIKNKLLSNINSESNENFRIVVFIANFVHEQGIDKDDAESIAIVLKAIGDSCKASQNFSLARDCFAIAAKKFEQINSKTEWAGCLFEVGRCFQEEGELREESQNSIANSLYEQALQAYRRVPKALRSPYDVESQLNKVQQKMDETGLATLDEMALIKTPTHDISETVELSRKHVSGKEKPSEALRYFVGIFPGFKYEKMIKDAEHQMKNYLFSSLFGGTHFSNDGRVVARVPAASLANDDSSNNQKVIKRNVLQNFGIESQVIIQGNILPSLNQILLEHSIERELLVSACYLSPIVPENRHELLGYALWLGFEYEFGNAIHLLSPQIEHIVRTNLKEAGANTRRSDENGITNEIGLSSLLELTECKSVFGEDITFELKAIFSEALGFNLRNNVAHGLLDDNSACQISSVYAWWFTLKIVLKSINKG
ncbi:MULTISPECIES: DUF4209 domain-containing protein [Idiomarina]|uniref:DUF4209 domain-containing protein n=1 Tax=Idiomarina TaxID=135575 RepID=UPI0025859220|nr:DUF4209 domain-containing protein [Idiomarina sp.]